ncbi:MAG: hypothetical protein MUD01_13260 [Chloroflexaceae bacterium]|jgi:hypothetical protein|nr:hypothetical protein [Chloroflexaceae bacterium]
MKKRMIGAIATVAATALITLQPVFAATGIGNAAFQRTWDRQDKAVLEQNSGRSWTWGPEPISPLRRETYVEGVEGLRPVQYFDKSRMEINDPTADPNQQWYVTNGLLPIELMSGRMQIGNSRFEFRGPARVSAIGDQGQFPTYADLLPLYQNPGAVNPGDLGKPATGYLNVDGSISGFSDFANDPATILVRGENNHGVAKAFVDFMNQQGLVYENGRYVRGQVYDPIFVFGLPVSGAYWVKAKVGGKEVPILFQVFERRVLTYNPANPPAFRVEMGNVGQHYYQWRYNTGATGYPAP